MEQRGGGRDLTGSPKLLDGKHWANKLLQVINIGNEATCLRTCFNVLEISKTPSASFWLLSSSLPFLNVNGKR